MNLQSSITRLEKDKRTLETEVKSHCSISPDFCLYALLPQKLEGLEHLKSVHFLTKSRGNVETASESGDVGE